MEYLKDRNRNPMKENRSETRKCHIRVRICYENISTIIIREYSSRFCGSGAQKILGFRHFWSTSPLKRH